MEGAPAGGASTEASTAGRSIGVRNAPLVFFLSTRWQDGGGDCTDDT